MAAIDPGFDRVRIVSWNVNMALARKAPRLLALRPDIAVVQECAQRAELDGMTRVGWTGRWTTKGLAVFARPELGGALAEDVFDPTREWFLPVRFEAVGLNVLACWAMNYRGAEEGRPKQGRTLATMEHYREFLSEGPSLVIGDLNNNVIWDTPRDPAMALLTEKLSDMGMTNLYYARTGETPGQETAGSLYFYRHRDKPYLIDHAFLADALLGRVLDFRVGDPDEGWLGDSDHTPLMLDLEVAS